MTDPSLDPELDELVTAYVDGEATTAERARVQGDPVLLARAEQLRAVSKLIAEPVAAPDAGLRDTHIAAALEASSTSPVVTAMPVRRNRPGLLRFASVAAVVLAILVAVPLLVSNTGGNDEDMATGEASSADDGLAEMDAVAAGESEMAAEEEPATRSADDAILADSDEMAPLAESAEDFGAESAAEESAADVPADVDAALTGVARIDVDEVASPRALRLQVERRLATEAETEIAGNAAPAADPLVCGPAIAREIARRGPAEAFGSATVDGDLSEYVFIFESVSVIIVFDPATCEVRFGS